MESESGEWRVKRVKSEEWRVGRVGKRLMTQLRFLKDLSETNLGSGGFREQESACLMTQLRFLPETLLFHPR